MGLRGLFFIFIIAYLLTNSAMAKSNWYEPPYNPYFNVLNFGAIGDGKTDDSKAFLDAWWATCSASCTGTPTMYVPSNLSFLINPTVFKGPCNTQNINIQVEGYIVAPGVGTWDETNWDMWLVFYDIDGLSFTGSGTIDSGGSAWWERTCKFNPNKGCYTLCPTELKFVKCNYLSVSYLNIVNSPQMGLVLVNCQNANITGVNINSPQDSPNTDGIHLASSQHVRIQDSIISTGDDCISIGDMTSDVVIDRVTCGPGHGISIGSLGKDQSSATVEEIHVLNSNFFNTTNGARIKTWQGGKGYAKSISFQNISLSYVENPIIIDQYYCTQDHCDTHSNAVEISDITYSGFWGTSMNNCAVSLNCSKTVPCTNIQLNNINITSVPFSDKKTEAVCINAYGDTKGYINPEISCLN